MNGEADRQDLAAEYALGTLDAAERAEAESLIAEDFDFAAQVATWEHRFGELSAMVAPVNPPSKLWAAIEAQLAQGEGAVAAAAPAEIAPLPLVEHDAGPEAADRVPPDVSEAAEIGVAAIEAAAHETAPHVVAEATVAAAQAGEHSEQGPSEPEAAFVEHGEPSAVEPEAAFVAHGEPGAVEPEAVSIEHGEPGPGEPEAVSIEHGEPGPGEPEAVSVEHSEQGPSEPEAAFVEHGEPGAVEPEAVSIEHGEPGPGEPEAVSIEHGEPGPGEPEAVAEQVEPVTAAAEPGEAEAAAVEHRELGMVEAGGTEPVEAEHGGPISAEAEAAPPDISDSAGVEAEVASSQQAAPTEVDAESVIEHGEPDAPEPEALTAKEGETEATAPELLDLDAAFRQTAERIAAEAEAARTEGTESVTPHETTAAESPPALWAQTPADLRIEERGAPMEQPSPAHAATSLGGAADFAATDGSHERWSGDGDVAQPELSRRMRRWRGAAAVFGALAAGLVAVILVAAHAPEYLPQALRPRPEVRTVEVPREVVRTVKVPTTESGRFVAVLQTSAATPAFIITVDVPQRRLTVRRVAAEMQTDHSYELWLMSNRFQRPRSLGVIGASEFTHTATLAAYDPETISDATFAVSLEPEGGSPTGEPTGAILFSGKLVEAVPPESAAAKP